MDTVRLICNYGELSKGVPYRYLGAEADWVRLKVRGLPYYVPAGLVDHTPYFEAPLDEEIDEYEEYDYVR
jgi:hypothetical protein